MDTDIFDTEISVTNVTKVFIELSASRIHRKMIKKLRSLNSKSVHLVILTVSMIAVIFAAQQQQVQASDDRQASPNDDPITAGWKEGKNDYLNGNAFEYSCPSSNSDTYCSLYRTGYGQGWNAQAGLGRQPGSEPQGSNDNDNN
jgi:hypothetical protein